MVWSDLMMFQVGAEYDMVQMDEFREKVMRVVHGDHEYVISCRTVLFPWS